MKQKHMKKNKTPTTKKKVASKKDAITNNGIYRQVKDMTGLTHDEVVLCVRATFKAIHDSLLECRPVQIRGIGMLTLSHRSARNMPVRNSTFLGKKITVKSYVIPETYRVKFIATPAFKRKLLELAQKKENQSNNK